MDEGEIGEVLGETPIFSVLNKQHLKQIARDCEQREFGAGDIIIHEGDTATSFFVILEGQVDVRRGDRSLAKLGRGQYFGETALLGDQTRSADVIALRKASCLVLTQSQIREIMASNPAITLKLLEESIRRERPPSTGQMVPLEASNSRSIAMEERAFEFKSARAGLLFDYLVTAFIEDYMRKRYTLEKSGWRGIPEAARHINLSQSTLYGRHGSVSPILGELIRRGFVETRIFPGERGRGGEIIRLRVAYERKPIGEYVNQRARGGYTGGS